MDNSIDKYLDSITDLDTAKRELKVVIRMYEVLFQAHLDIKKLLGVEDDNNN